MKILTFLCALWYIESKIKIIFNGFRREIYMTFGSILESGCSCGKEHRCALEELIVGAGVISRTAEVLKEHGIKRPFLLADINTYKAAGEKVADVLDSANMPYSKYVFNETSLEPDERAVGAAIMHFDTRCDAIVAVGSGVIGDIAKIVANTAKLPYIIVATAPSMDGYASASSSMAMDGVKVSLNSKCAEVIIGDTDVLKAAPEEMLISGLGDMLAKYVSICEWRLSNLINGEYYCEEVAEFTRQSLRNCVNGAKGLLEHREDSMKMLFEGLINCGKAMDYAGCSRPGGGVEHYFSHIWDMRGLDFGTPTSSHGMQVALGTLNTIKCYQELKNITPNREKALAYAKNFDFADWSEQLRSFVGKGAEAMIELEAKEKKYDLDKHAARLEVILEKWDDILRIIDEELPTVEEFEAILDSIEAPKTLEAIGLDSSTLGMTCKCTKDIRDKYVLPRLLWDIGELDDVCEKVFG